MICIKIFLVPNDFLVVMQKHLVFLASASAGSLPFRVSAREERHKRRNHKPQVIRGNHQQEGRIKHTHESSQDRCVHAVFK